MSAHSGVRVVALALFVLLPATTFGQSVIGVLGIAAEIAPIEKRLKDSREITVQGYVFREGTLNGRRVVVGRSGAGKVNAAIITTLLIGQFKPSAILFSGTAGAVDPALFPGDVVIGKAVAQHDVGLQLAGGIRRRGMRNAVTGNLDPLLVQAPEALLSLAISSSQRLKLPAVAAPNGDQRTPQVVEGVIVTGDVFMADVARRAELRSSLGATAIEMEGAAVIQACRQFNVACLVIRSITDRADGQAATSYEQFVATASENAAALVASMISRLGDGVRPAAVANAEEGTIVGHVRTGGQGIAGVSITMIPERGGPARSTTSNRDGSYLFEALPDDIYRLDFETGGFDVIRRNHVRVRSGESINVDAIMVVSSICECTTIPLSTAPTPMAGRVVDEDNRPLPYARLEMVTPVRREVARADSEGRFLVHAPLTGTWLLTVSDGGFEAVAQKTSSATSQPLVIRLRYVGTQGLPDIERLNEGCGCFQLFPNKRR